MNIPVQANKAWVAVEQYTDSIIKGPRTPVVQQPAKLSPSEVTISKTIPAHLSLSSRRMAWRTPLQVVMNTLHELAVAECTSFQSHETGNGRTIQSRLKECLVALDGMQETLQVEFNRLEHVEQKACADRADLAQTRSELVGTRIAARLAHHKSMHDELTALPNRACFLQRLDQALANAERQHLTLGVLFIDLDGFKSVNDANGHLIGDAFLQIMAARLARMVRADDTICRFGGDEFATLINGADRNRLADLAGKFYTAISEPVKIDSVVLAVRPSIGISVSPGDGATAEELLKCADDAMYRAKTNRFGFVFHDSARAGKT